MFTLVPTETRLTETDYLTVAGHQAGGGRIGGAVLLQTLARGAHTVRVLGTDAVLVRLITGQFDVGEVVYDWGCGRWC